MDTDYFLSNLFTDVQVLPVTVGAIVALILAFLLLIFSGIISASEIAFFSLTPSDKSDLSEKNNSVDHIIVDLLSHSEYLLATILILNNFVNVAVVMLCTYAFSEIFDFSKAMALGFVCETILLTFLILLFGEIIPKIYAQTNSLKFARRVAPLMNALNHVGRPLSSILVKSTNIVNRVLNNKKHDVSVDELSKALELTSGEISDEKEMLEGIIKLYNTTVVEIMTPRLDIYDINIQSNFREVINYVVNVGYSRIPVYLGSRDNIKGVLYIKDLLPYIDKPENFRWQSLIRPAFFVPETKKIDDLLEEFRTNKIHLAVVVDEFGGTSGIVTMEDILEEIVGEINDEYDEEDSKFEQLEDGSYIFDAKILLVDFFKIVGLDARDFGKLTEDVDTLAGLVLELKGDFPKKKEVLEYEDYTFQVLEVNKRRILKIRFFIKESKQVEEDIEKV